VQENQARNQQDCVFMRQVGSTTYSLIRLDGLDQLHEWQSGVSMK